MNNRTVGVLVADAAGRDAVAQQLAKVAEVVFADCGAALLQGGRFAAVISQLDDVSGQSIAPIVVKLAVQTPNVPVILYDSLNRTSIGKLVGSFAAGLPIDFVVRDAEPIGPALRRMLSAEVPPTIAPLLLQRFLPLASPSLALFVALAALKAPSGRGIEHLARWSGASPRTILRRMAKTGWQRPSVLLQSFRALDAAWLIAVHHWSARKVATIRGLGSSGNVGRLLRRYLAIDPLALREPGSFRAVVDVAQRDLVSGGARRRPPAIIGEN
jgi:hypothetical protein